MKLSGSRRADLGDFSPLRRSYALFRHLMLLSFLIRSFFTVSAWIFRRSSGIWILAYTLLIHLV
jgi:hypothetical protein